MVWDTLVNMTTYAFRIHLQVQSAAEFIDMGDDHQRGTGLIWKSVLFHRCTISGGKSQSLDVDALVVTMGTPIGRYVQFRYK